jgi:hypothetical protein
MPNFDNHSTEIIDTFAYNLKDTKKKKKRSLKRELEVHRLYPRREVSTYCLSLAAPLALHDTLYWDYRRCLQKCEVNRGQGGNHGNFFKFFSNFSIFSYVPDYIMLSKLVSPA